MRVADGRLAFDGLLVRRAELLDEAVTWTVRVEGGELVDVELEAGALGLTVCQVPVVVAATSDAPSVEVEFVDGTTVRHDGDHLDRTTSAAIFGRTGEVARIRAAVQLT